MKTCKDCHQTLPLTSFVPAASYKGGYEHRCRQCRSIKYNKSTPELLCKKIYLSQGTHSARRGHPIPTYTLQELTAWVTAQPNFAELYAAWKNSNYSKELAPSVDRIKDATPYGLDNIQLMSWADNRSKGAAAKLDCTLLVNHRAVAAYTKDGALHKRYASLSEAMRDLGGNKKQTWGITTVCNGEPVKDGRGMLYTPRSYKGYIWKWAV